MTRSAAAAVVVAVAWAAGGLAQAGTADELRNVAGASTLELTTTGRSSGQERAVTIWFVAENDHVFVQSGQEGKTDWYRNLLKQPGVKVRIGTVALRGEAHAVDDAQEVARVHALFERKYLRARVVGWFGGSIGHGRVVRIDRLEPTTHATAAGATTVSSARTTASATVPVR